MKKEEIFLADWQRILLGDAPVEFLLEVFLRTSLIYFMLLVMLRLLGKRMNGQLTNLELAVMLTMGAIMSPAMQLPDRGVFPGILALVCALAFLRGTNLLGFKSSKAETIIQGTGVMIVKDGVIQIDEMKKNRLSHQQVYAALRSENVYNLGKVRRMYMEAYGNFSIFQNEKSKPGLSVMPPDDEDIRNTFLPMVDTNLACGNCGNTIPVQPDPEICSVCHKKEWDKATL
jgi:uncharacterized membrane protein YcaP (DUF421 family)